MNVIEAETPIIAFSESLPHLVWTTDPTGYHDFFNRRWYAFTGLSCEESLGEGWMQAVHPEDLALAQERWAEALEAEIPYEIEYRIRDGKGSYNWFLGRALPVRDGSGRIQRWLGTCTDIQRQKTTDDAFHKLEEQHRVALEAAGLGTWSYDIVSGLVSWDERACILYDTPLEGLLSISFEESFEQIHPEDRDRLRAYIENAKSPDGDGIYAVEFRIILRDGGFRWIRSSGRVFFSQAGRARRAVRISGVSSDVTERRAIKEAHQLLTHELIHRVKNLFAIASGLVSMTARTAKDPKDMATALRGRFNALARAHELARPAQMANAESALHESELGPLIDTVLAPYSHGGAGRVCLQGPDIRVGANAMTSLALVLHELATNAAKYGSLSNPDGNLQVTWTIAENAVDLLWSETGGPAIAKPPTFQGFGTMLSQRSISGQLGGTLDQDWRREGLLVRMTLPLERLSL